MSKSTAALLVGAGACLAVALGWLSISSNLERTCTVDDTTYLDLCARPKDGSPEHLAALQSRISANPGDSGALLKLALLDKSPDLPRLIHAASALAPRPRGRRSHSCPSGQVRGAPSCVANR